MQVLVAGSVRQIDMPAGSAEAAPATGDSDSSAVSVASAPALLTARLVKLPPPAGTRRMPSLLSVTTVETSSTRSLPADGAGCRAAGCEAGCERAATARLPAPPDPPAETLAGPSCCTASGAAASRAGDCAGVSEAVMLEAAAAGSTGVASTAFAPTA